MKQEQMVFLVSYFLWTLFLFLAIHVLLMVFKYDVIPLRGICSNIFMALNLFRATPSSSTAVTHRWSCLPIRISREHCAAPRSRVPQPVDRWLRSFGGRHRPEVLSSGDYGRDFLCDNLGISDQSAKPMLYPPTPACKGERALRRVFGTTTTTTTTTTSTTMTFGPGAGGNMVQKWVRRTGQAMLFSCLVAVRLGA